jgi:hypothetical protein
MGSSNSEKYFSSNLPIISIYTYDNEIRSDIKIPSKIEIYKNPYGNPNYISDRIKDEFVAGIESRGYFADLMDKKSYNFEIRDKKDKDLSIPLLGLPAESDWILYGPYNDKTLIRNHLMYQLYRETGHYASRTAFVELFLKIELLDTIEHEYQGIYLLIEKIKPGPDRVNISKITDENPSGGYILERLPGSRIAYGDTLFKFPNSGWHFGYVYPEKDKITPVQVKWIESYLSEFEDRLYTRNFDPESGYQQFIDIDSFVDDILIQEFSNDVDSHHASMYLHKDKDSKLKMGPIWDFNIALGNANYDNGEDPEFARLFGDDSEWSKLLMADTNFTQKLDFRWKELRANVLSTKHIYSIIDSTSNLLMEAQERNFEKWDIMGKVIWPNPKPVPMDYQGEIKRLKEFIEKRLLWMDREIPDLVIQSKTPIRN